MAVLKRTTLHLLKVNDFIYTPAVGYICEQRCAAALILKACVNAIALLLPRLPRPLRLLVVSYRNQFDGLSGIKTGMRIHWANIIYSLRR